jgi:hypothetical protein
LEIYQFQGMSAAGELLYQEAEDVPASDVRYKMRSKIFEKLFKVQPNLT